MPQLITMSTRVPVYSLQTVFSLQSTAYDHEESLPGELVGLDRGASVARKLN